MTFRDLTPREKQQHEEYLDSIRKRDRVFAEMAMRNRAVGIAEAKVALADPTLVRRMDPADIEAAKRQLKALIALDIKEARDLAGITQDAAAALTGVSRPKLAQAEGGMYVNLSVKTLDRIRALLHQKIAEDSGRPYVDPGVEEMLKRIDGGGMVTSTPGIPFDTRDRMREALATPLDDGDEDES